jgi:hypothetical protein
MHRWLLGTPNGLVSWRGRGRCVLTIRHGILSSSMPSATATVPCSIPRQGNCCRSEGYEKANRRRQTDIPLHEGKVNPNEATAPVPTLGPIAIVEAGRHPPTPTGAAP